MKSKKSFYSKTIIKSDLRLFGFIGILYTLLLGYMLPYKVLMDIYLGYNMSYSGNKTPVEAYASRLYSFDTEQYTLLVFTVPVILALLLFRYIQNTRSVSKLHAWPYTRTQLYNSHIISGFIITTLPLIVNSIILIIGLTINGDTHILPIREITTFCLIFVIVQIFMYLLATATGMIVGSTILTGILTYIFLFLPYGLYTIVDYILSNFLYGYSSTGLETFSYRYSPVIIVDYGVVNYLPTGIIPLFIVYCIILYVVGLKLYQLRHLERNNELITFNWVKYIFVYGVTFCSMILVGAIASDINSNFLLLFTIGSIIGGLIGYGIATCIAYKTFRIHRYYKGFIAFTLISITGFSLLKLDLFGYVNKIPDINTVNYVAFNEHSGGFNSYKDLAQYMSRNYDGNLTNQYTYPDANIYELEENIQSVLNIHKQLLDYRYKRDHLNSSPVSFLYVLKNGKTIKRTYYIDSELIETNMKALYENDEYTYKNNMIYKLKDEDLLNAQVMNTQLDTAQEIDSIEEMQELVTALRKDLLTITYEDYLKQSSKLNLFFTYQVELPANVDRQLIRLDEKDDYSSPKIDIQRHQYTITPAHKHTVSYLKSKGLYEELLLQPEDIDAIVLYPHKNDYTNRDTGKMRLSNDIKRITSTKEILLTLNATNYVHDSHYYIYHNDDRNIDVYILLKDGTACSGSIVTKFFDPALTHYIN